jgi:hypothetical protein
MNSQSNSAVSLLCRIVVSLDYSGFNEVPSFITFSIYPIADESVHNASGVIDFQVLFWTVQIEYMNIKS